MVPLGPGPCVTLLPFNPGREECNGTAGRSAWLPRELHRYGVHRFSVGFQRFSNALLRKRTRLLDLGLLDSKALHCAEHDVERDLHAGAVGVLPAPAHTVPKAHGVFPSIK